MFNKPTNTTDETNKEPQQTRDTVSYSDQQMFEYFAFLSAKKNQKLYRINVQQLIYLSKALAISTNQKIFQDDLDFCKKEHGPFSQRLDECKITNNTDLGKDLPLYVNNVQKPQIPFFVQLFLKTMFKLYSEYSSSKLLNLLHTPVWDRKIMEQPYTVEDLKKDAQYLNLFARYIECDEEQEEESNCFINSDTMSKLPQEFFQVHIESKMLADGSILYY